MDTEIPLSPHWLMKVGENKVCPHEPRQLLLVHGDRSNTTFLLLYISLGCLFFCGLIVVLYDYCRIPFHRVSV
jgi:hypothetical protein